MDTDKISNIEAIFLIIIVMITHIILNLPNNIIVSTGSASVLNTIYVSALAIIFFLIINKMFTPFGNKDIIDVSEYLGGNVLKITTTVIYTIYLLFISSILILNFSQTLQIIYFQNSETWVIIAIFLIVAIVANKLGFKNVVKSNALIMPLVLINVIIIFLSSIDKFEPQRMLPLIGFGTNETFITGATNIFAFGGLIYLFLIRPNLKNSKDYKKVGLISIAISSLYLILSVASLSLVFPYIANGKEVLSIYLSSRNIEFGKFFQRTDAIFIFIWIFAFIAYLSVILAYIVKINKKCIGIKNPSAIIYIAPIIIICISLIPSNVSQIRFAETVIYKYAALGIVYVYNFIILLLANIKRNKIKN